MVKVVIETKKKSKRKLNSSTMLPSIYHFLYELINIYINKSPNFDLEKNMLFSHCLFSFSLYTKQYINDCLPAVHNIIVFVVSACEDDASALVRLPQRTQLLFLSLIICLHAAHNASSCVRCMQCNYDT